MIGRVDACFTCIYCVQAISKEIANHASVKLQVMDVGTQLLAANPDDSNLRQRLDRLDADWQRLVSIVPDHEGRLHMTRMPLLSSGQVLDELLQWLRIVEDVISDDGNRRPTSAVDVQLWLKKYRV